MSWIVNPDAAPYFSNIVDIRKFLKQISLNLIFDFISSTSFSGFILSIKLNSSYVNY